MARPAPQHEDWHDDDSHENSPEDADYGWPRPRVRSVSAPERQAPGGPPPGGRRRRGSALDRVALGLLLLGLLAAAAAGLWYLRLDRSATPTEAAVPSVVGLKEAAAVSRLTALGFNVRSVERPGPGQAGRVFSQRPSASVRLALGATVTIRVANGQKPAAGAPAHGTEKRAPRP